MDHKRGTKAPQAAGKIHSDFESGFIRAGGTILYTRGFGFYECSREKGLVRSEGRIMKYRKVMLYFSVSTYSTNQNHPAAVHPFSIKTAAILPVCPLSPLCEKNISFLQQVHGSQADIVFWHSHFN